MAVDKMSYEMRKLEIGEKDNRSTHIGAQFRWSCFQICTKLAKILDTILWPSVLIADNLEIPTQATAKISKEKFKASE